MDKRKDMENEVPINETLKTGPDNVNENGKGHEVETMEMNKKRNTELTAKTPADQSNYAMDNGHEKKPQAKKNDRTHAVMDTENEAPINETLKTGPDNVNENGKGHEVETTVLNKKRNTRNRSNKVTAKAPSDQLNDAVNSGHDEKPEAQQFDKTHAVMDTENESPTNETLKTGLDNVNKNGKGHGVKKKTGLNKRRNTKRRSNKVTAKNPSDQLNHAVNNGHEKKPEAEKHGRTHAVMDTE